MHERYSIEVNDEIVEIYGDLTIEEAFDFLSFFERKGYKSVVIGSENSTLRMMKIDHDELNENKYVKELKEEISHGKSLLNKTEKLLEESQEKLKHTESLFKKLMHEEKEKYKKLQKENSELIKSGIVNKLKDSPVVQEAINFFDDEFDDDCEQNKEKLKQELYENLIKLKNDYPYIPMPKITDFYINPNPTKE